MSQVSEILEEKGHNVLRIDADASILEAVKQMVTANVGSLLVMEGDEIAGIVTQSTKSTIKPRCERSCPHRWSSSPLRPRSTSAWR